jgi:hypothetical protein
MRFDRKLEFGLNGEIPEDAPAAWGARAIQQDDYLDFPHDRQSIFATNPGSRKALLTMLNDAKLFEYIQEPYREARLRGELASDEMGVTTLFDSDAFSIKADTRASFGHVYICGYLKSGKDVSKAVCSIGKSYDDLRKKDQIMWSSEAPIPNVGDEVIVHMNDIGKSIVLSHDISYNFVLLHVWPSNPPDWYRGQNKLGRSWKGCSIFGADLDE